VKAGPIVHAQHPVDAADHAANDTADNGADRTGGSFALPRSPVNSTGDPLGLGHNRQRHGGGKGGNSNKTADHDIS
jgi:hypothetical protein